MKVFHQFSMGSRALLDAKSIIECGFFSELEMNILLMFHNWVRVGFAVECNLIEEESPHEKRCGTIIQYSILFTGTEECAYRIPIGIIAMLKDKTDYNVSEIINTTEELIRTFFSTVEIVKKTKFRIKIVKSLMIQYIIRFFNYKKYNRSLL